MLDHAQFPGAHAYLEQLPAGLESFPNCRVRALVFEHVGRERPELAAMAPEGPLRRLLRGQLNSNDWVPEVVGQVANLLLRDAFLESDGKYLEWTYEMSLLSFNKPLIRQLMRLMSPSLLVLGAAKRWSALHDGTQLSASGLQLVSGRSEVIGHLVFPECLFPILFLEGLCPAFRAALSLSRGRDIAVELSGRTATSADYRMSWRA